MYFQLNPLVCKLPGFIPCVPGRPTGRDTGVRGGPKLGPNNIVSIGLEALPNDFAPGPVKAVSGAVYFNTWFHICQRLCNNKKPVLRSAVIKGGLKWITD